MVGGLRIKERKITGKLEAASNLQESGSIPFISLRKHCEDRDRYENFAGLSIRCRNAGYLLCRSGECHTAQFLGASRCSGRPAAVDFRGLQGAQRLAYGDRIEGANNGFAGKREGGRGRA